MVEVKCEECQSTFQAVPCKKRRFCSKACASRARHRLGLMEGKAPGRKKNGELLPCENCGAAVYVKPWQKKIGQGRFCGAACYNTWQGRNSAKKACEWCGKEMGPLSPFRASIQRFCNRECQTEGRRTNALEVVHNGRRASQDNHGYVRVWEPEHPNAYDGWVLQHRLVMEGHLGRLLLTEEHVHHVDGDKMNNSIENLIILGAGDHQRITVAHTTEKRRIEAAELEEYRRRYGPLE